MPPPNLSSTSDQDLVARILDGDESAFAELHRRYQGTVLKKILGIVQHQERAEDLTQETFNKAFIHLDRFRPEHEFGRWIVTIAGNTARNYVARQVFRSNSPKARDLFDPDGNPPATLSSSANTPTPRSDTLEFAKALEEALGQLRYEHRQAFILHHFEYKQYDEIAAIMRIPRGTVGSYLTRARKHLRRALKDHLDPERTPKI